MLLVSQFLCVRNPVGLSKTPLISISHEAAPKLSGGAQASSEAPLRTPPPLSSLVRVLAGLGPCPVGLSVLCCRPPWQLAPPRRAAHEKEEEGVFP